MAYDWGAGASGAMTGGQIGMAVGGPIGAGIGAIGGATMGFFGKKKKDEGPAFSFTPPEYYLSGDYEPLQSGLIDRYSDVLSGDLPDYYKPIGEYGGSFFEGLMSDIRSDVTQDVGRTVDEDPSRKGLARGGLGTSIKAMSVADTLGSVMPQLRLSDYERALNARGDLFGIGLGGLESARSSSLSETQLRNQFNLGASELSLDAAKFGAELAQNKSSATDAMLGEIMKIGTKIAMDKIGSPGGVK